MLTAQEIIKALQTQSFSYEDCSAIYVALTSNRLIAVDPQHLVNTPNLTFTQKNQLRQIVSLKVGNKVTWSSKKNPSGSGTVIKVNRKTCSVLSDSDNEVWTVPVSMLKLTS
jgi:hypothetical protein